jgi:hypothetical protein
MFPVAQRIKAPIEVNCQGYTVLYWQSLYLLGKVHGGIDGQVEIGCDDLLAPQQSFHPDNIPNAPTAPQYDLICAIYREAKRCPIAWLLSCRRTSRQQSDGHPGSACSTEY